MWFCENKKKRPLRSSLIICAAATALFTWGFSARYLLRAEESVLAIDPSGSDEGYSAVLYNSENGLPTSEANAIEETEEGFSGSAVIAD